MSIVPPSPGAGLTRHKDSLMTVRLSPRPCCLINTTKHTHTCTFTHTLWLPLMLLHARVCTHTAFLAESRRLGWCGLQTEKLGGPQPDRETRFYPVRPPVSGGP